MTPPNASEPGRAGPGRSARVIPVIDVRAGRAVHARGGDRAHYGPVRSTLHGGSDPTSLALAFRDKMCLDELYLADLDAIAGGPPAEGLWMSLLSLGLRLWVDSGVRDASTLPAGLLAHPPSTLVVGLETVRGPAAFREIVQEAGAGCVVFSLDLRRGRPLVDTLERWGTGSPEELARYSVEAGCRRLLLLDLARVGMGDGVGTLPLLRRLAREFPGVELAAGGGVAGPADLDELAAAGASTVLVGSALHDGRITRADLTRRGFPGPATR